MNSLQSLTDKCVSLLKNPWWFCGIALTLLLGLTSRNLSPDLDLFHRLATGKLLLSSPSFPYKDPFSFSETLPIWIDHEWLSGVVFYKVYDAFGDPGLLGLRAALFACTITLVVACNAHLTTLTPALLAWIVLCLLHGSFGWSSVIRCQAFTYLFIPLFLLGFIRAIQQQKWGILYATPIVMLLWCNLHGGFVLGLILLALFVAHQILVRNRIILAVAIFAASFAATAVNPYGFTAYWGYLIDALSMSRPDILEWKPLLHQSDQFIATLIISFPLTLGAAVMLLRKDASSPAGLPLQRTLLFFFLIIGFSGYSALRHSRFLVFYMVVIAALGAPFLKMLAETFSQQISQRGVRLSRVWGVSAHVLSSLVLYFLLLGIADRSLVTLRYDSFPVGAIDELEEAEESGRLLVDFNFGAYCLWRLYPRFLISMDSRYETAYTDAAVAKNHRALTTSGAKELQELAPTHILITGSNGKQPLAEFEEEWNEIYSNGSFRLFKKNP